LWDPRFSTIEDYHERINLHLAITRLTSIPVLNLYLKGEPHNEFPQPQTPQTDVVASNTDPNIQRSETWNDIGIPGECNRVPNFSQLRTSTQLPRNLKIQYDNELNLRRSELKLEYPNHGDPDHDDSNHYNISEHELRYTLRMKYMVNQRSIDSDMTTGIPNSTVLSTPPPQSSPDPDPISSNVFEECDVDAYLDEIITHENEDTLPDISMDSIENALVLHPTEGELELTDEPSDPPPQLIPHKRMAPITFCNSQQDDENISD